MLDRVDTRPKARGSVRTCVLKADIPAAVLWQCSSFVWRVGKLVGGRIQCVVGAETGLFKIRTGFTKYEVAGRWFYPVGSGEVDWSSRS